MINNSLISHQMRGRCREISLAAYEGKQPVLRPLCLQSQFPGESLGCSECLAGNRGQALQLQMGFAGLRPRCRMMDQVSWGKWFDRTPALACWLVCLRNPLDECFCSFNPLTFPQTLLLHPLSVYSSNYFINLLALIKCQ